ncbi:MAG TPA: hypothetical protein VGY98_02450, partial [Verrucomicrobiae bacterium]|nr:hypothetical protein [Verrucomicrobiae bacterium]
MSKRKKDSNQTELPIEGAADASSKATKPAAVNGNGNGADHVIAETVENIAPKPFPFDPKKRAAGLHTRVDRGFLEYASYVIRDRA